MKRKKIAVYIIEFMLCGAIGWTYETILTSAVLGSFADRGVLHLPVCPIYGVFAAILLIIVGKMTDPAAVFASSALIASAAELVSSYLLEYAFHMKLWDYSGWAFNFDGRISLFSSLIFGAMGLFLIKLLHPALIRMGEKLSCRTLTIISSALLVIFSADLSCCLIR